MNSRENFLEAVRFGSPDYVPLTNEPLWHTFQFDGNFRSETWTDSWGVGWEVALQGTVPFPKGHPLPDLERLADYRMPDPSDLVFTEEMKSALSRVDRGEKLMCGSLTYLLFERAWAIMGMEGFLTALITHPAEARAFCHGIATYARGVFDRYLELGVDAVSFSEDLGTQRALMISPQMFREFILPEYEYCFENVLRAGTLINFHSCGCVDAIAADLAGIGVSILNPVQARANDLGALRWTTDGVMAVQGAIDTALLVNGTPLQIRDEVVRVMGILKGRGGFICGPDQSIPGIPDENMAALWRTAAEIGRY
jgi:uroporphyrinogen decarboxylase